MPTTTGRAAQLFGQRVGRHRLPAAWGAGDPEQAPPARHRQTPGPVQQARRQGVGHSWGRTTGLITRGSPDAAVSASSTSASA